MTDKNKTNIPVFFTRDAAGRIGLAARRAEEVPATDIQYPFDRSVPPPAETHDFVKVCASPVSGLHPGLYAPETSRSGALPVSAPVSGASVFIHTPQYRALHSGQPYWGRWGQYVSGLTGNSGSYTHGYYPTYVVDDPPTGLAPNASGIGLDFSSGYYVTVPGSPYPVAVSAEAYAAAQAGSPTVAFATLSGWPTTVPAGPVCTMVSGYPLPVPVVSGSAYAMISGYGYPVAFAGAAAGASAAAAAAAFAMISGSPLPVFVGAAAAAGAWAYAYISGYPTPLPSDTTCKMVSGYQAPVNSGTASISVSGFPTPLPAVSGYSYSWFKNYPFPLPEPITPGPGAPGNYPFETSTLTSLSGNILITDTQSGIDINAITAASTATPLKGSGSILGAGHSISGGIYVDTGLSVTLPSSGKLYHLLAKVRGSAQTQAGGGIGLVVDLFDNVTSLTISGTESMLLKNDSSTAGVSQYGTCTITWPYKAPNSGTVVKLRGHTTGSSTYNAATIDVDADGNTVLNWIELG